MNKLLIEDIILIPLTGAEGQDDKVKVLHFLHGYPDLVQASQ